MTDRGLIGRMLDALKRLTGRDQPPPAVHWPTPRAPTAPPARAATVEAVAPSAVVKHESQPAPEATSKPEVAAITEPLSVEPSTLPVPSEAVEAFVAEVKQLPLFSGTALQLMKSVGNEDVSTVELARLISGDAGLVAQLLRIVNSPYYGLPKRCATVADAISVLGFAQVRRTVSAAVTQRPLATYLQDTRVVRAFWRHGLLSAAMARHLALQRGLDGELAYMAGLMHEIGRLAMLIQHPHLTDVLLRVEGDDDHLGIAHELSHFGFDHAQVGGALLARWGLPAPIVQATYDHGDAEQPHDPMSAVVWRANLLAHDMIDEPDDQDIQLPWMAAVGLTVDDRRRILDEIAALEGSQH